MAVATVFTLSPLTVIALIAAPLLIRVAGRGLPSAERRMVFALLATALALRAAVIAAVFLLNDHDSQAAAILTGDEAYTIARTLRIRNILLGVPALKHDYALAFEDYGRTSYLWIVTAAQLLFGPSPYGLRLMNALLFLAGAILLYRLARRSFGPLPAGIGLALLLFLPTWLLWSISLLKESLYFFLAALVLTASIAVVRGPGWLRRVVYGLVAAAALFALRDLRDGAIELIVAALIFGLALFAITGTRRRVVLGTVVVVALAGWWLSRPASQAQLVAALESAAQEHIGHVFTRGHPYKLLDDGFYVTVERKPSLTPPEAARFVVRAFVSVLVVPLPGQIATSSEWAQLPEHLVWLVLIVLTPVGLVAGGVRDRLVSCLLIGYVVPTLAIVALTNGNIGTLVRFRGLATPYLVWLGALGFCVIIGRLGIAARPKAVGPLPLVTADMNRCR